MNPKECEASMTTNAPPKVPARIQDQPWVMGFGHYEDRTMTTAPEQQNKRISVIEALRDDSSSNNSIIKAKQLHLEELIEKLE